MHARRPADALQRPAEAAERENLLLFVWLQDVAHPARDYTSVAVVNVSAVVS